MVLSLYNTKTTVISKGKLEQAIRLRDELDEMIETAEILGNKRLMASIRRSENDLGKGKVTRVTSHRELDDFFRR